MDNKGILHIGFGVLFLTSIVVFVLIYLTLPSLANQILEALRALFGVF